MLPMAQDAQWLSTEEAAERLGYSAESLRRWDRNGIFIASRRSPGGIRYYRPEDVDRFAASLLNAPIPDPAA